MQPRGGCERRVGVAVEQVLPDGDGRPEPGDGADLGGREAQLGGTEGEDLEEAPPGLVVQRIEDERRLTRARDAGDDRQAVAELDIDVPQVVLARALDLDLHGGQYTGFSGEVHGEGPDRTTRASRRCCSR